MKKTLCKILSITLVVIMMLMAIPFTASAAIRIGKVEVTDLDVPIEGNYGDYTVTLGGPAYDLLNKNDVEYINGIRWIDENGKTMVPGIDRFIAGVSYTVEINLVPLKSNIFMVMNATLNGEEVDYTGTLENVTITKTFAPTEDSPNIHKITFDYGFNGIVEYGFCYTGEELPVPNHYDNGDLAFFAWYDDPEFTKMVDFSELVFEDKTIYARYVDPADIVSVYMYTTDNDFPYRIEDAVIGDYLTVEDPYEEGLFFTEWYGDPDRVWQYNFEQPITGDVYLYARMISYDDVATVYTYMPDEYFYTDAYEVEKGRTVNIPDPEVEGMYFAGWYFDREFKKPFNKYQPITEDIALYAKFVPLSEMHTAKVYIEDDSTPSSTVLIQDGYYWHITNNPSVEGKTFFGWYCEPERINRFDFSQPITEDVSIYAKFVDNDDLCYVSVCIEGDTPISTGYVEKGTTYSRPDPSMEGKTFFGWYCEPERINKFDFTQPITEDVTIYAKFVADEDICYVNIYLDGDMPIASGMVEKGTTYSIEDPAKEDMYFDGWYCEPERINKFDFTQPITEDVSIYAKFVPIGLLGDANDDGKVNILDATLVQTYVAKYKVDNINLINADVDKDGLVTIQDATAIQMFVAKMISNFETL